MFRVYMTNFGYYLQEVYDTFEEAKRAGQATGFQFKVEAR